MTRRISAVALCCSAPSVSACCSCAYGTPGWPLSLALLSGTPHARQKSACEGLSYWHRGHFMPEPPSGRVGERSEPWAETTRPGLAWSRTRSHGSRLGTARSRHLSSVVRCPPRQARSPLRLRDAVYSASQDVPARGSHNRVGPPLRVSQIVPLHLGEVELLLSGLEPVCLC